MRLRSIGGVWIVQILMVALTILGVGVDVLPISLLVSSNATESDIPFAPDSEDGQDEAPDGLGDIALLRSGELAHGSRQRVLAESLAPAPAKGRGSITTRPVRTQELDIPTRLCRLTC